MKRLTQITENKINADLLYADLTYSIRGCVFSVYNELGFGHKESVYQKALTKEFESIDLSYKKEFPLKVSYKGVLVGNYRPDFIIDDKIIIELKAVEFVPKSYEIQLLQYLKATEFELGLLINFGGPTLYIKRLINQRKSPPLSYQRKSAVQISDNHSRASREERG